MRVLVVGSLPPPESARGWGFAHRGRRTAGRRAHGRGRRAGSGSDRTPLHLCEWDTGLCASLDDSGFILLLQRPAPAVRERAGRLERELSLVALALVLRRGRHVVIHLESRDDLPGGPAGRGALLLWRSADRIVVGSDAERAALVAAVGVPLESAVTGSWSEHGLLAVAPADDGAWGEGSDISAENVLSSCARGQPENGKNSPASRRTCPVGRGFRLPGLLRPSSTWPGPGPRNDRARPATLPVPFSWSRTGAPCSVRS